MKKRILVVDDDEAILLTIKHTLVAEGFKVYTASDGSHALKLLDSIPRPDLVITDLSMHPVDGRAFIMRLKQNPHLRDIPVVVVSAEKDVKDIAGVATFIEKPFQVEALLSAISAAMDL